MVKSKEDLRSVCANWDGKEPAFAQIVADYLELTGKEGRKALGRAFGVGKTTIARWANGINAPHNHLLRVVIERIEKLLN